MGSSPLLRKPKTGYPGWDNPFLVRGLIDIWKRSATPTLFGIGPVPVSSTSQRDASETGGTLPRAKNSPPDCFYGSLRCRRPFESRPANQKRVTPDGITRFWYKWSYETIRKGSPDQRFSASDRFRFDPHPYGMRLKPEGLSHGLKTVHRTVFTAADAAAALSSPLSRAQQKYLQIPKGIWRYLVRERGLEPPRDYHTHLKRACLPFQHSRKCLDIVSYFPCFVNPFLRDGMVGFVGVTMMCDR